MYYDKLGNFITENLYENRLSQVNLTESVPHRLSQTDTEIVMHTPSNDHTVDGVAQHCVSATGAQSSDSSEHESPNDTEIVSMDIVQCEESVDSEQETDMQEDGDEDRDSSLSTDIQEEDTRLSVARSLVDNLLKIREILSSNYTKTEKVLERNPPPLPDCSRMSTTFYGGDQEEEEEEEYEEQADSGGVPVREKVPDIGGEERDGNSRQPDNVPSKWTTWRNSQT